MTEITNYINALCGIAAAVTAARRAASDKQLRQRRRAAAAMTAAARIYNETVRQDPRRRSRTYWYDCIRQGWRQVRDEETVQRLQTVEEFLALPGEEQDRILRRIAAGAPRRAQARIIWMDGAKILCPSSDALWMVPAAIGGMGLMPWGEAIAAVAHQTWIDLAEGRRPARDGLAVGQTLARMTDLAVSRLGRIARNTKAKARRESVGELRQDYRSPAASIPGPEEDTLRLAAVEAVAPGALDAVRTIAAAVDPDAALRRLGADVQAGRLTLAAYAAAATAAGYTQGQAAAAVGVKQYRVSRALDKLRAAAVAR